MKIERLTTATLWIVCGSLAAANVFVACSDRAAQTRPQPDGTVGRVSVPQDSPSVPGSTPVAAPDAATSPMDSGFTTPVTPPTPTETRAAWREGVSLYDKGDYERASEQLTVAAAGRSKDAYTHYLLGLALWKTGRIERSEQELARSVELNPESLKALVNLARVRLDRGDAPGALTASESALELDPSSTPAMHQKGRALAAMNRTEDALTVLGAAHDWDPKDGYVANTLGWLLIQSGTPGAAVPVLESAKESLPNVAFVRNNLGVAYERTGRREEALAEYKASVEHGDTQGKSAASLARLGDSQGDGTTSGASPDTTAVIPTVVPKETTSVEKTKPVNRPAAKTPSPSGR